LATAKLSNWNFRNFRPTLPHWQMCWTLDWN